MAQLAWASASRTPRKSRSIASSRLIRIDFFDRALLGSKRPSEDVPSADGNEARPRGQSERARRAGEDRVEPHAEWIVDRSERLDRERDQDAAGGCWQSSERRAGRIR